MSAEAPAAAGEPDQGQCWCCGGRNSQDALVHLGNHPEVGICQRPVIGPALRWVNQHLP